MRIKEETYVLSAQNILFCCKVESCLTRPFACSYCSYPLPVVNTVARNFYTCDSRRLCYVSGLTELQV